MGLEFFSCACFIIPVFLSLKPLPEWILAMCQSLSLIECEWHTPGQIANPSVPARALMFLSSDPSSVKESVNMTLNDLKYSER